MKGEVKDGAVIEAAAYVKGATFALDETLSALQEKLGAVLTPDAPHGVATGCGVGTDQQVTVSDLARNLNNSAHHIEALTARVRWLTERVEL